MDHLISAATILLVSDDPFGGGMIALVPHADDRKNLAVDGGEAPHDLHLTVTYLGPDAGSMDPEQRAALLSTVQRAAQTMAPIQARVFGHAHFNPDGYGDRDPAVVYLVGDSTEIPDLFHRFAPLASAEQHAPYIPHVTAAYGADPGSLSYTGPVTFDKLRLAVGDHSTDFPLTGGEKAMAESESKADGGNALPDGTYKIEDANGLKKAVNAIGAARPGRKQQIRKHCIKHAKRLGLVHHLPASMQDEAKKDQGKKSFDDDVEFKGKHNQAARDKMAKDGRALPDGSFPIDDKEDLRKAINLRNSGKAPKSKVHAHIKKRAKALGATDMLPDDMKGGEKSESVPAEFKLESPDPRAARLRNYWAHNPKALAKWRPGQRGDFNRLVRQLRKYVHNPRVLKGLAANIHKEALGVWPGREHAKAVLDEIEQEEKAMAVDTRNPSAPDDEDDDELMSRLNGYESMGDNLTAEDAYEQQLAEDIPWELSAGGDLVGPNDDGTAPAEFPEGSPGEEAEESPGEEARERAVGEDDEDDEGEAGPDEQDLIAELLRLYGDEQNENNEEPVRGGVR